eukprot:15365844-Ditylum_brightwellii.AAC.1
MVQSSLSLLPSLIFGGLDEVVVIAINDGNVGVTDLCNENGESKSDSYITNKNNSNAGSWVDIDEKEVIPRNNDVIAAKGVIKTEAIIEVEEQDEDSNLPGKL